MFVDFRAQKYNTSSTPQCLYKACKGCFSPSWFSLASFVIAFVIVELVFPVWKWLLKS